MILKKPSRTREKKIKKRVLLWKRAVRPAMVIVLLVHNPIS